jgi:hypothetical protein
MSLIEDLRSSIAGHDIFRRHPQIRVVVPIEVFPLFPGRVVWPGAVKGAPLLGAAKRTLDGEYSSKTIGQEGKDPGNTPGNDLTRAPRISRSVTVIRPIETSWQSLLYSAW